MRARIAVLVAMAFCVNSVLMADQFGDVVFQRPEGWSSVRQADAMLLIPQDVPKGFVLTLAIRKGEPLDGRTLRQFLDDKMNTESNNGATVTSSAPVQESKIFSGIPVLTTTRVMAPKEGSPYLVQYFVLEAGSRGETITVISNSKDLVKKYSAIIGKFIAALEFQNPQE